MDFEKMIKLSSPYSWNQYFTQEECFTVHLYTKNLENRTPQILSLHSKLLGSSKNNIQRLNQKSSNLDQFDIIFDDGIKESCVLDFIELLKCGNIILKSEEEMTNINFLLSVFGLTSSIDFQKEIEVSHGQNRFDEWPTSFQGSNVKLIEPEEPEIHESLQQVMLKTIDDQSNSDEICKSLTPKIIKQSEDLGKTKRSSMNRPPGTKKTLDVANFKETKDILVSKLKISSKDLKCKLCRKIFKQTYQMAKHLTDIHGYSENISEAAENLWLSLTWREKQDRTDGKEMRCMFCQKKFEDNYNMRQHISTFHLRKSITMAAGFDDQREMKCSSCKKQWKTDTRWLEHFLSTHKIVNTLFADR